MTSLLLVDDDSAVRETLGIALRRAGFSVEEACSLEEARRRIETRSHDAVVADFRLGDGTALDLLCWMRGRGSRERFIVITAFGTIPLAVQAMRDGASHFLSKPVEPDEIVALLRAVPRVPAGSGDLPPWLVASSPAMRACVERARVAAGSRSPVLLTGATGTGKEVLARFIHESGPRREKPFVAINCAAVAASLFESEFFGHVRGAYTGAAGESAGVFREAQGGTLLLDEVGELAPAFQVKLLRAIELGEVRPVGAASSERVDVRILSSTNVDPQEELRRGRLREDFYYRLSGTTLSLAPLAGRREDVLPLARHFLQEFAGLYGKTILGLSPEAATLLEAHAWPGNVRELRNAVERAVTGTPGPWIDAKELALGTPSSDAPPSTELRAVERDHILKVLAACGQNRTQAAVQLGISRSTLQRKLIEYGVADPS